MKRILAVLAAVPLAVTAPVLASAGPAPADGPPECVHITVIAYQRDGTVHRIHLEMCGNNGPGSDSPLRDAVNWGTGTLDGATAIGNGCGSKTSPCVIFGP